LRIATLFQAAGIQVIVLKGPAVALTAYGDLSRRTFTDVDLLVRREDILRARQILTANGYKTNYPDRMEEAIVEGQHALELLSDQGMVELHWAFFPRHLHLDFDLEEIWREAVALPELGTSTMALSQPHRVLYLCAHGAKHRWFPLRWIVDLAQTVVKLSPSDGRRVVELARRYHCRRILALGLRVIRDVYPEDRAPFDDAVYGSNRSTRRLVAFARKELESLGVDQHYIGRRSHSINPYLQYSVFWIDARERLRDRMACRLDLIFKPSPGDANLNAFGKAMRPFQRSIKAVAQMIRSSGNS
jgi:hypothetical protein